MVAHIPVLGGTMILPFQGVLIVMGGLDRNPFPPGGAAVSTSYTCNYMYKVLLLGGSPHCIALIRKPVTLQLFFDNNLSSFLYVPCWWVMFVR